MFLIWMEKNESVYNDVYKVNKGLSCAIKSHITEDTIVSLHITVSNAMFTVQSN